MRLREFVKEKGRSAICISCAIKYGLEFLPTESPFLNRSIRSYRTPQRIWRPTNASAVVHDDDNSQRGPQRPTQQKLHERLQRRASGLGGVLNKISSSPPLGSTPDPRGYIPTSPKLPLRGQKGGLPSNNLQNVGGASSSPFHFAQDLLYKHQKNVENEIDQSGNDDSWGSFARNDELIASSGTAPPQELQHSSDPYKDGQRLGYSDLSPTEQDTSNADRWSTRVGRVDSMVPVRRHRVKDRPLVRKSESDHYPSEPNENYRYRPSMDPFQSRLRQAEDRKPLQERTSKSFGSGMSVLEDWARDPRASSPYDSDKLPDFESTFSRFQRKRTESTSIPSHRGGMSVLDWKSESPKSNSDTEGRKGSSGSFVGSGLSALEGSISDNGLSRRGPKAKDEEVERSRHLEDTYNVETESTLQRQKIARSIPEVAVQQDSRLRRPASRIKRSDPAEDDSDLANGMVAQRPEERRRASRPRRASRRDEEGDEVRRHPRDFDEIDEDDRPRRKKKPAQKKQNLSRTSSHLIPIHLPEFITVERLAAAVHVDLGKFLKTLRDLGYEDPSYDHILDYENSSLICQEFNFEAVAASKDPPDLKPRPLPSPETRVTLPHRPPIVTIMGHVDHGKTTILDWLRKSSVAAAEHGGITQHIGAFSVRMPGSEKTMTFLDTPGHAAFLEMRRRGATVTDIVVLVVAADDSVKPQTIEAIKHAQGSKVAIIVAINKVDKEDANIERVKQDLARHGIDVESFGGETQAIPVSGKTGQGMVDLEEAIIAEAENLQTQVEFDGPAEGWIIEGGMGAEGRLATVLVRRGTLRSGDVIVAGKTWSRIRCLRNDAGTLVDSAPPGTPVVVDGWRDQPDAGAEVLQAESENQAKTVVDLRVDMQERAEIAKDASAINAARREEAEARARQKAWESEQEWSKMPQWRRPKDNVGWVESANKTTSGPKRIDILVKADVAGSVEAVVNAVSSIGNNEIATNVIDSGVGPVNESDIEYLAATGGEGYIISFNQQDEGGMVRRAEAAGVPILSHTIIYKVTDDLTAKLSDKLSPIVTQKVQGEAEVGQVFTIDAGTKNATKIAGCKVTNGLISRERKIRVLRNKETVFTGTLDSLKHLKRDVTEMRSGTECGMGFEGWDDFKVGDQIQSFDEKKEKRSL